ncbi:hypothetical protein [Pseudoxanthomonas beigongshangi]|uniref:hypothetical protein n=1 Tax=Pseudoxanthomonas beigongshangi TaxID=2782537 RepID=UPI00193B23D6|nr:hypothetical protein [Pseudoxanthomonas beigongshangi]
MELILAACAGLVLYGLLRAHEIFQQWQLRSELAQRKFIAQCAFSASLHKAQQEDVQ